MYDSACHLSTLADALEIGRICDEYGFIGMRIPIKMEVYQYMETELCHKICQHLF